MIYSGREGNWQNLFKEYSLKWDILFIIIIMLTQKKINNNFHHRNVLIICDAHSNLDQGFGLLYKV